MRENISWRRTLMIGGAFIAFLLGSGFATGQEVMQYFVAYGYKGILTAALMCVLFVYVGVSFITTGYRQKYQTGKEIFRYYCGETLGKFFEWFSVALIYMSFIVMVAGAGAALQQQFSLPVYTGAVLIGLLSVITVSFGLKRIVEVIGTIGPVIVVLAIFLGVAGILRNPQGLLAAPQVLAEVELVKASANWFLSGVSYVGLCIMWLAAFLASMGAKSQSGREAGRGAALGAIFYSLAVVCVMLGLLANLPSVAGSQVPSLILAAQIAPWLSYVFAFIVIAGIFTTSVPLLWTACSRLAPEENSRRFRIATVVLGLIGVTASLILSFDKLMNLVYVVNGYIGFLLLVIMAAQSLRRLALKRGWSLGFAPAKALPKSAIKKAS